MQADHALQLHLEAARDLAASAGGRKAARVKPGSVAAHLEKARALAAVEPGPEHEPIRTIHHLSCTGGTLITKCIAAMANVLVLNEVDLHSTMTPAADGKFGFTPTDMISLLRQGDQAASPDLISSLFLKDLEVLREAQWRIGRHLVLRDHSHSHFLTGDDVRTQPTLLDTVASRFPTRSIVTVRNPIDSWLSMEKQGWHKSYAPSTFDEYCRRYLLFLDAHEDEPIIKYEDFVADPHNTMQRICNYLGLAFFDDFEDVFGTFHFSGDSGRQDSKLISARESRSVPVPIKQEISNSVQYWNLVTRLDYMRS